jgi:DNA-binding SARP family transcriptional activator/tetratricopeptide (TPR) repeat protein
MLLPAGISLPGDPWRARGASTSTPDVPSHVGVSFGRVAVRIDLSGRLRVQSDATVLEGRTFPGRQVRLAFAYLVVHRQRPVPRDELAEALWPGMAPPSWERNLSVVISRLRTILARVAADRVETLTSVHGCYQLQLPPGSRVDSEEAASALDDADTSLRGGDLAAAAEHAQRAAELARRPFLPGDESTWVEQVRAGRRRQLVHALDIVAQGAIASGHGDRAITAAEEAVELEPLRETGYQQLIRALAAAGDRARALQVHERCRRLLAEELGVAPSQATEAAYLELLRSDVSPPGTTHLPLPSLVASRAGTPFVGRTTELERLRSAFEQVSTSRRPRVVVLSGEPGIGKTALALRFALDAHASGATVLAGRCDEETPFPYQPFVEALRQVGDWLPVDELRTCVGHDGSALRHLLPVLADRVPGLPGPGSDPGKQRYLLFEAVTGFLARLSETRPLVMVLEDMQWAGRGGLLLARHLARSARPLPLLMIDTCRTNAAPTHAEAIADLRRDDLVVEISLSGLDEAGVRALIEVSGGASAHLAEQITSISEGNPLFVREITRHLAETSATELRIPQSLRGAIIRRLDRLPPAVAELLTIAAVGGRDFRLETLCLVSGRGEDEVIADLEIAARSRLIAEVPGAVDVWSFSDALVRETVYADISASRRARLHRAIADVLVARVDPAPHLAEIARHFAAAGSPSDLARASTYARQAGDVAMRQLAFETAAAEYESALSCLDARALPDDAARCGLLFSIAEARARGGDGRAAAAYVSVVEAARRGDPGYGAECLARAAIGLADIGEWSGSVDHAAIGLLEEGLDALGDADTPLRAHLLGRLAGKLFHLPGSLERRRALTIESVAVARRLGDPQLIAGCLHAHSYAVWGPGDAADRLATGAEIVRLADDAGDRELSLHGHGWCAIALLEMGDVARLDEELAAYDSLANHLRHPHYRWYARTRRTMRVLLAGTLDVGERMAHDALALGWPGRRLEVENAFTAQMGAVWLERPTPEALQFLEAASVSCESRLPVESSLALCLRALRAAVALELGDVEAARSELRHVCEVGIASVPRGDLWGGTLAHLARPLASLGSQEDSESAYRLLLPHAGTAAQAAGAVAFAGSFSHHLAVLATALGRWDEAERHFAAAAAMHADMGALVHLTRTRLEWAAMLSARRHREDAQRCGLLLRSVGPAARALGLPGVTEHAAELHRSSASWG